VIQRGLAFLREARNAPVHPATALLGAACVVLGAGVVQRFLAQQQAALAAGWREFQVMQAQGAELARQLDEMDQLHAWAKPTAEDLDPLGRGAQADDCPKGCTEHITCRDDLPDTELVFDDLSDHAAARAAAERRLAAAGLTEAEAELARIGTTEGQGN
jgi:hypothetical protein